MSWVYVDYATENWVHIPTEDGMIQEHWKNEKDWARSSAIVLREFNDLDRDRKEEKKIANRLIGLRQAYQELDMARDHYAYFANPAAKPLPLLLSYWTAEEGNRDEVLRRLARADATDLMKSPQVTEFAGNRTLGTGLRSRNYVKLEDESVTVNLWYAFRNEEHHVDLVAHTGSDDLGANEVAEAAFDELVRGVWLLDDEVDLLSEVDVADNHRLGPRDR